MTAATLLMLGLGVGCFAAALNLVHGVLWRPFPFPDSDRVVAVYTTRPELSRNTISGPDYVRWAGEPTSFEELASYVGGVYNVPTPEGLLPASGVSVTSNLFAVYGVQAKLGRVFSPLDEPPGAPPSVVLSHDFFVRHFDGDESVLGKSLEINNGDVAIVGVMPPGFREPLDSDFWLSSPFRVPDPPFPFEGDPAVQPSDFYWSIGRLQPGATPAQAEHELTDLLAERVRTNGSTAARKALVVPLLEDQTGAARRPLLVLLTGVLVVLLIGLTNTFQLLLVEANQRRTEIAIRTALGASRRSILTRLTTEGWIRCVLVAMASVPVAWLASRILVESAPRQTPRLEAVSTDVRLWISTFVATLLLSYLAQFSVAVAASHSIRLPRSRAEVPKSLVLRRALIAFEVAIGLPLLFAAGLLVETSSYLADLDPGFEARQVLTAQVFLPGDEFPRAIDQLSYFNRLTEQVRALGEVDKVGLVLDAPHAKGIQAAGTFVVEGRPLGDPESRPHGRFQIVDQGYFEVLAIPVLAGRGFDPSDRDGTEPVAVINQTAAKRHWPSESPIGQRISLDEPGEDPLFRTIVGVVGDVLYDGPERSIASEIFVPLAQEPVSIMSMVVRTRTEPSAAMSAIRRSVATLEPEQPLRNFEPLASTMRNDGSPRRFLTTLSTAFGAVGQLLVAVALFAVLSSLVTHRRRELGVRAALGARPGGLIALVLAHALRWVLLGALVGLALCLMANALLRHLVHGVPPYAPLQWMGVLAILGLTTLFAASLPAVRASRTDPVQALRQL